MTIDLDQWQRDQMTLNAQAARHAMCRLAFRYDWCDVKRPPMSLAELTRSANWAFAGLRATLAQQQMALGNAIARAARTAAALAADFERADDHTRAVIASVRPRGETVKHTATRITGDTDGPRRFRAVRQLRPRRRRHR